MGQKGSSIERAGWSPQRAHIVLLKRRTAADGYGGRYSSSSTSTPSARAAAAQPPIGLLSSRNAERIAARTGSSGSGSIASTGRGDRKSTRLNSSHLVNSYAVFCLQKKNKQKM